MPSLLPGKGLGGRVGEGMMASAEENSEALWREKLTCPDRTE